MRHSLLGFSFQFFFSPRQINPRHALVLFALLQVYFFKQYFLVRVLGIIERCVSIYARIFLSITCRFYAASILVVGGQVHASISNASISLRSLSLVCRFLTVCG